MRLPRLTGERLYRATLGLGIGTVGVGIVPYLVPRAVARLFGVPGPTSPVVGIIVRSVGARDAINGLGIVSATIHAGRVAPWILARTLADAADLLAVGLAWRAGARSWRTVGIGIAALGATILDVLIYRAHRAAPRAPFTSGPALRNRP